MSSKPSLLVITGGKKTTGNVQSYAERSAKMMIDDFFSAARKMESDLPDNVTELYPSILVDFRKRAKPPSETS